MQWLPRVNLAKTKSASLLPLRDTVLFPSITMPVIAGRLHSAASVEAAMETTEKQIVIAALRPEMLARLTQDKATDISTLKDVYPIGTLAVIRRMTRLPNGLIQMIVEGLERVHVDSLNKVASGFKVTFHPLPPITVESAVKAGTEAVTLKALIDAIKVLWTEAASMNPNFPDELLDFLTENEEAIHLAYHSVVLMQEDVAASQAVLEEDNLERLLRQVLASLQKYVEEHRLRTRILGETKQEINEQQREFFLRQQLKKIQEQLGEGNPDQAEMAELQSRLAETTLPEPVAKQIKRELSRLERVGSSSAEGGVIRTYLDWLLEMPWAHTIEDNLDLDNARTVLDSDHYGLAKVKARIIEHLATFKLKRQAQRERQKNVEKVVQTDVEKVVQTNVEEDAQTDAQIQAPKAVQKQNSTNPSDPATKERATPYAVGTVICFVGPPGVGKTSLGRSIAHTLGRPFERISLGGMRDEAELRGHRRTYIGAMPGRIVQAIHRAGVKNPVIMLDELDKVGMDYRGDPASVLLEILDPQQNTGFHDLYLDLDFDLTQVIFIATANDLAAVPPPLLDRLELIELSGYSDREKRAIAHTYLLPRQLDKAGLPPHALQLSEETLRQVIDHYTREAGVRHLEQKIGSLCRKVAVKFAAGETSPVTLHPEQLETLLGPKQYLHDDRRSHLQPGVATGLAWTLAGGEVLFVEALLLPQGKTLTLTGQLGDVMEESVQIARSYIWAHAAELGIELALLKDNGLHLHIPAGAIPKDGPSAGVTMFIAIASLLLQQPVRNDTAMTGEIDLSGDVLPVGGLREKVLAAHRAGIQRVLLPKQNEKDLVEVPDHVREEITFIGCDRIEQVLENALLEKNSGAESNGHGQLSEITYS